jgi:DNA-binding transcriptional MocR family regulator
MRQRPGIIDLGLGHPDPSLLPLNEIRAAAGAAFELFGEHTLNYGFGRGPGPLSDYLRDRIATREGKRPDEGHIMITGGTSHGLDHLLTVMAEPGDTILFEAPSYHLAARLIRDHPARLVGVPSDADGLIPTAFAETIHRVRASESRPLALYCVPTFNNPTGASWTLARRKAVLDIARAERVTVIEDDVYRELAYDREPASSLWSMASDASVVIRFGSFSKSLAPGLRVGWMTAEAELVARIESGGLLDSGGGVNQFAAMCTAAYCLQGGYDAQIERFKTAYRARRDALVDGLRKHAPDLRITTPGGGFFVWAELPAGVDEKTLLEAAQMRGVSFLTGARFYVSGAPRKGHMRLCFTLYPPDALGEAAHRLGQALRAIGS